MKDLIKEFKKNIKGKKELSEIVEEVLHINKTINRYLYDEFEKKTGMTPDFLNNLKIIYDFSQYFIDCFVPESDEDLENPCKRTEKTSYNFTKKEFYEEMIAIWNGLPPFVDIFDGINGGIAKTNTMDDIWTNIFELYEDNGDTDDSLDLFKKITSVKGTKQFVYVNMKYEIPVEFEIPQFSLPEKVEENIRKLKAICSIVLHESSSTLVCIVKHKKIPDEVFGVMGAGDDWLPIPTVLLEDMYNSLSEISDKYSTDYIAKELEK